MSDLSVQIEQGNGGWYVEVYTDDDNGSGYGDNPRRGRWYGTLAECKALDPATIDLHPDTAGDGYDPVYSAGYAYACGYRD